MADPFTTVDRAPSLSDKVAALLTDAIVSRRIKPGERLPSERDLGLKFKVSRTVVREAVRSLSARGLVRVTSGRGVEAAEANSSNVADSMRLLVRGRESLDYGKVHEVRTALEVETAGLAAERAEQVDIERLRELCDRYAESIKRKDFAAAGELDFQFHRELTRSTGNELLLAVLDSIADVLREVRNQSIEVPRVAEDGLRAHRKILKCVSSGDVEMARNAMVEHLLEAERVWRGAAQQPRKRAKRR